MPDAWPRAATAVQLHFVEPSRMKAVICGAGVAGLTLATQLGRGGWQVIVLERECGPTSSGYLVDLAGKGLAAAERLGLLPQLKEAGKLVDSVRWVDERGRQIAEVDLQEPPRSYLRGLKILRGDLERILLEGLPSNVEVRFGFDVAGIRTPTDSVEVELRPTGHITADVLVGADGVHSRIRDLVFGDGGLWSCALGYDTAAFAFHDEKIEALLEGRFTVLSAPGRHIVLCPLHEGRIAAMFVHRSSGLSPPHDPLATLVELYGPLKWCVPKLLRHARAAREVRYEPAMQVTVAAWHRGRVGLLGDACHAYSLLPGQGASVALASASWLGTEMVRAPSVDTAFSWYQSRLSSDIADRRTQTRRAAQWLVPASGRDLALRNGLLKLAAVPGINRLVRSMVSGMA
jgi:2-polyprenyl-6-methoxyphenol hydroxylase-like FAD-dependent oxidoreductase